MQAYRSDRSAEKCIRNLRFFAPLVAHKCFFIKFALKALKGIQNMSLTIHFGFSASHAGIILKSLYWLCGISGN